MGVVKEFTCIQCPVGCQLEVELEDGVVVDVRGNACPRGKAYGTSEATHPVRMVTTLVDTEVTSRPVSVKTSVAVAKECVGAVVAAAHEIRCAEDAKPGDVVAHDIAGTGADLVVTRQAIDG